MEFVEGLRADDLDALRRLPMSLRQVAANGAQIFMKMAFELGVFHGDPHPGNLRIRPDGAIALLDYGMIGYLEPAKRDQLIDLFVAVIRQQPPDAVDAVLRLTQPSRSIDAGLLQSDIRDFVENYYGVPLDRLRVGPMLSDFVAIIGRHGLRCPADLLLLIRAIVTLEGVGRRLDPDFNLANELAPFTERLVRRRYDPRHVADRAWSDVCRLAGTVHDLPHQLHRTLTSLSRSPLPLQIEHRGLDRLITEFDRSSNRIVVGVVTSAILVSSALVLRGGGSTWINVPAFLLSGLLGVWLIYGIFRSGRL
jgi:ubiquinone biosynthesis protein